MNPVDSTPMLHTAIAAHVLRTLAAAQRRASGERLTLADLTERLGVRRADVRSVVSRLHREGHVDAQRMRLTLSGFALGAAMLECAPPSLRTNRRSLARATRAAA